jgi:hypothetical protein
MKLKLIFVLYNKGTTETTRNTIVEEECRDVWHD